jgi:Tol biopolymer transport system component/DNA-binding winged helix-turn-helix (wHTH) protein
MDDDRKMYEFGEFRLDVEKEMLFRGAVPVPLTPKVFETLVVLVENAGKLVEKNTLMERIWHDRFVEESNLTFNIKMLRKALGDQASLPRFIETAPRKGYRFIAEISEVNAASNGNRTSETFNQPVERYRRRYLIAVGVTIILVVSSILALSIWQKRAAADGPPILTSGFNSTKLSDTGRVSHAVISPDGRFVAYVNEVNDRQSIWLRHLESSNNTEIMPASNDYYFGLVFTHGGGTLFFTRSPMDYKDGISLYSIPITGGVPSKIAQRTQGWISVSPDDRQISFVRYEEGSNDRNSLMMVDVDGKNERLITASKPPNAFWSHTFLPDGKRVVAVYGRTNNSAKEVNLAEIDLASGEKRNITSAPLFSIRDVVSLPDQSGLLFSASETIGDPSRIHFLDLKTSEVRALTNDSVSYSSLSLDRTGEKLVATTATAAFHLYIGDADSAALPRNLTQARDGFAFAPDGKIVYASDSSGTEDIWIVDADGSRQRQLTTESSLDSDPIVSPDNRYIYFTSNRTGKNQIWRMNMDGTGQIQITQNDGGYPRFVTPDGKLLYFQSRFTKHILQVPTDGGQETEIFSEKKGYNSAFSPDGGQMAYLERDPETKKYSLAVIAMGDQSLIKRFAVTDKEIFPYHLKWSSDGKWLSYVSDNGFGKTSVWRQYLTGEPPKITADLGSDDVMECQFSPDGTALAYIRGNWQHDAFLITGLR